MDSGQLTANLPSAGVPAGGVSVSYLQFTNAGQEARIRELIVECLPVFPHWMAYLWVYFDDSDEGCALAKIYLRPEYLMGTITVYSSFFRQPSGEHRRQLLHELAHAQDAAVLAYVREHILPVVRAQHELLWQEMDARFTECIEMAAQDRSRVMDLLLGRVALRGTEKDSGQLTANLPLAGVREVVL